MQTLREKERTSDRSVRRDLIDSRDDVICVRWSTDSHIVSGDQVAVASATFTKFPRGHFDGNVTHTPFIFIHGILFKCGLD